MDGFTFNKIAGAGLFTVLCTLVLNNLAHILYRIERPEKPGFAIAVTEVPSAGGQPPAAAAAVPIAKLLQTANSTRGEDVSRLCHACHTFDKGGGNKVGPNLWGVVDRPIASHAGFNYDQALRSKSADKWTYEDLNKFLANPQAFAPGTKMTFAGVRDDVRRADLIAYLRTLSDNPEPLPQAQ